MTGDKLARLANRIAMFFRPYPDAEALAGIADHIVAFWTPGMREGLLRHIASHPDEVDTRVIRAMHGAKQGDSPIAKEIAGPQEAGQLGSDAG